MAGLLFQVLCLGFALASVTSAAPSGMKATLTYSGTYAIHVNDKQWFWSTVPFVVSDGERYSINNTWFIKGQRPGFDRELWVKSQEPMSGTDILGPYTGFRYVYFAGPTRVNLNIRQYDNAIIFTQEFPNGLQNKPFLDEDLREVITGFPAFEWNMVFQSYSASGYMTFSGDLTHLDDVIMDRWDPLNGHAPPSGSGASTPLCLFNTSSTDAVIIAPLTNVMHVSSWHRKWVMRNPIFQVTEGQSYWGVDRDLLSLPSGFKVETIMVYSPDGIGKAFERWGAMHRLYNQLSTLTTTAKTDLHLSPTQALSTLGYWSGQGSYYHGNTTANMTFENILLDVKQASVNNSVPLGFVELDKWWYYSANDAQESVVTWEANNQSLPSGLRGFGEKMGLPLVAVLGSWSSNTTYAKQNNGSYHFLIEGDYALPLEYAFWLDLFMNASSNNIVHVILDDMAKQYKALTSLKTQSGLASDWLKNVSFAAYAANLTLTFSQATPRMLLEASKYPAVVQSRVSAPYLGQVNNTQWIIGVTSILAKSLGLAPFKDVFWSHSVEDGNPYGKVGEEANPTLQALVATLSRGFVVLGDQARLLASPDALRCCRADGVVLKPATTATAIDSQIIGTANLNGSWAQLGQTWSAVTSFSVMQNGTVTSLYTQGIAMTADSRTPFKVTPSAYFPQVYGESDDLRVFSWVRGELKFWAPVSDANPKTATKCAIANDPASPCVFYVSPAISLMEGEVKVHLAGEDKFVPLSPQRVHAISTDNQRLSLALTLTGQPEENVTMFYYVNDEQRRFDVTIDVSGTAHVSLNLTAPQTTTPPVMTTMMTTMMTTTTTAGSADTFKPASLMMMVVVVVAGTWVV